MSEGLENQARMADKAVGRGATNTPAHLTQEPDKEATMGSREHTPTTSAPQPRLALVAHLREQIERDPEAFLRGRLGATARLVAAALNAAEDGDEDLARGSLEAATLELRDATKRLRDMRSGGEVDGH